MPRKVATQRDELSFKSHSVRKRSELKKKFGPDTGISYRSSNPAFLMVSDRKEARNPPTPTPPPPTPREKWKTDLTPVLLKGEI